MKWSLFALCIGFCIDLLIGDPHGLPHPVAAIGHLISLLERLFRRLFPKTPGGERAAGACIWILTVLIAAALPALLLWGCARVSVWLRLAVESVMCGQILAAKSLRDESMKVYAALKHGSLDEARQAVSMIVGRDVARLDARGVMRAAVETVAENTSDGVIAPMLFLAIGGAPLGFFYKAVNTMDSMLGYVEPPYKDIGLVPARILAAKSLRDESMKVYAALKHGSLDEARQAVSMIVGRDVARLDARGVMRAAVETVAENTSDGVIAPMLFLAIGGAPLGFFYKAVNTMDSMLGYVEPPYKDIGLVPARMDDVFNFIPARLSALLMLAAGALLQLDVKNGWKIFRRDRCKHASPNSAQTESVCAGLLGLRLAGDAWYHGVLHKKDYIGDAKREIELEDIPRAGRLMYLTAVLALVVFGAGKALLIVL